MQSGLLQKEHRLKDNGMHSAEDESNHRLHVLLQISGIHLSVSCDKDKVFMISDTTNIFQKKSANHLQFVREYLYLLP